MRQKKKQQRVSTHLKTMTKCKLDLLPSLVTSAVVFLFGFVLFGFVLFYFFFSKIRKIQKPKQKQKQKKNENIKTHSEDWEIINNNDETPQKVKKQMENAHEEKRRQLFEEQANRTQMMFKLRNFACFFLYPCLFANKKK